MYAFSYDQLEYKQNLLLSAQLTNKLLTMNDRLFIFWIVKTYKKLLMEWKNIQQRWFNNLHLKHCKLKYKS